MGKTEKEGWEGRRGRTERRGGELREVLEARKESSLRGDGSLDVRDRLGSGGELDEGQAAQLLCRMAMLVQDPLR